MYTESLVIYKFLTQLSHGFKKKGLIQISNTTIAWIWKKGLIWIIQIITLHWTFSLVHGKIRIMKIHILTYSPSGKIRIGFFFGSPTCSCILLSTNSLSFTTLRSKNIWSCAFSNTFCTDPMIPSCIWPT